MYPYILIFYSGRNIIILHFEIMKITQLFYLTLNLLRFIWRCLHITKLILICHWPPIGNTLGTYVLGILFIVCKKIRKNQNLFDNILFKNNKICCFRKLCPTNVILLYYSLYNKMSPRTSFSFRKPSTCKFIGKMLHIWIVFGPFDCSKIKIEVKEVNIVSMSSRGGQKVALFSFSLIW